MIATSAVLITGCAAGLGGGDDNIDVSDDVIEEIQNRYDEAGYVYEYTGDPVTISMSHWDSDGESIERAVLEVLLGAFNERYPDITVDLEIISDYESTYSTRFATKQVHDVFLVPDGVFANWCTSGYMTDLTPYIYASDLVNMDDMFESVVTRYQYDSTTGVTGTGNQLAMPRDISSHVMYYNKDLFESLGVELPPSDRIMTIEEAVEMWTDLTQDIDGDGTIDVYGVAGIEMEGLVLSGGGDFLNDDRTSFPTEESDIEALTQAYQFIQDAYYTYNDGNGILPRSTVSSTMDETTLFSQEIVATVIAGSWEVASIQGNSFDWDIAYAPAFEEASEKNSWSGSIGYSIYKGIDDEKFEAAWKLVEYIGSPEGQEVLACTGFQFPIYQSVASSEEYLSNYEDTQPNNYEIFLESAATQPAGTWTYLPSDQWREMSYDSYSAYLLDSDESDRWTVETFLAKVKTYLDTNL